MSEEMIVYGESNIEQRHHLMPAISIEAAVERFNALVSFVRTVMREGIDYGSIPGVGSKPVLFKPGAEKLCTLFGLTSRFQLIEKVEDFSGKDHNGEPFFFYAYRCQLYRGDMLITEADASCNSFEQKYRWRQAERQCPVCGNAAIIKGREEYGGGWICFKKKGGCGEKFNAGDTAIESQPVGRIPNQDIYDQVNTIQKMAEKRALVAAVLIGVNASEFFTQDLEDFVINGKPSKPTSKGQETAAGIASENGSNRGAAEGNNQRIVDEVIAAAHAAGVTEERVLEHVRREYRADSLNDLTEVQLRRVLNSLRKRAATK